MPGPYNPPNPYGSYFTLGSPDHPAIVGPGSFSAIPGGFLSPGTMSMMGMGSGGFNPTATEYLNARVQNYYQQQFMANVLRSDPRAMTLSSAMLQQMFGNNMAAQSRFLSNIGGRGNLTEMAGMALSFPGISGMMGGSGLALGQGAYAIAGSGFNANGRFMSGDGPMQMWAAQNIANAISQRFYNASGSPIMSMTQGLNRDQLGGLMMLAAGQGAFSNMNLMTVTRGGAKMDEGTMNKISQFVQTASKTISSLIDIYGNGSISELASKAQAITGLNFSRPGNADLMFTRITALRNTAAATGRDVQSMMDLSAGAIAAGARYGLTGDLNSAVGSYAANRAAVVANARRGMAGSFAMADVPEQELANSYMRDAGAMMRDPVGRSRAAIQVALNTGTIRGGDIAEARRLMATGGPDSIAEMNALMARQGISMNNFIQFMGGVEGLQQVLGPAGAEALAGYNRADVNRRARQLFTRDLRRAFPTMGGGQVDAMMELIDALKPNVLESAFLEPGEDARRTIMQNAVGPAKARDLMDAFGRAGGMGSIGAMKNIVQAMSINPWGKQWLPEQAAADAEWNDLYRRRGFREEDRGVFMSGSLMTGFLNRLAGTDPRTALVQAMLHRPGTVAGLQGGLFVGANVSDRELYKNIELLQSPEFRKLLPVEALRDLGINAQGYGDAQQREAFRTLLGRPAELDRIFHRYGVDMMPIGQQIGLYNKESVQHFQQWGNYSTIATTLAERLNQGGDRMARNFEKLAKAFDAPVDPKNPTRKNLIDTLISQTKGQGLDIFNRLSDEEISKVAQLAPDFREGIGKFLEEQSKNETLPAETREKFSRYLGLFTRAGYQSIEARSTKITGTLKWIGPDKLEFGPNTYMTPGSR